MENNLFSMRFDKEYNPFKQEYSQEIYLRVYLSMFKSGLVARLGASNFTTLLTIASFMDENGECYPTQRQLAERMGVHVNTVNKYVNELLSFEINGKPIITREKVARKYGGSSSLYRIQPLSQIAIFNSPVQEMNEDQRQYLSLSQNEGSRNHTGLLERDHKGLLERDHNPIGHNNNHQQKPENNNKYNAKDVISLFCSKYREVYNVNYSNINFGRDMKQIKQKLLTNYSDEQIEQIIAVAIEEYDKRWKREQYPRPTLPALYTWLADAAMGVIQEKEKQEEQAAEIMEITADADEEMKKLLEKL
jgi:predicted transcriptional regulator